MTDVATKELIVDGITPVGAYAALRRDPGKGCFLLESVVPEERWGRYSILGYRPRTELRVPPGPEPFAALARDLRPPSPGAHIAERFAQAQVGTVLYDAIHHVTKVEPWPERPASLPVARLLSEATVVVFDNLLHTATIASVDPGEVEATYERLQKLEALAPMAPPDPRGEVSELDVNMSDEEYSSLVDRSREYIRAGDAFQIVGARTFSTPAADADPFDVYRALRVLSPAPYMYILELPAVDDTPRTAIVGASPETLVRMVDRTLTLRPIAGTRRRGRSPQEDEALAREMVNDPKEIAEHVMLIDLARNDVGRVSVPGSVELPFQMRVDRFSHVMHIVSEVTGQARPELSPWDVVRACFPAGTLSGAPKVRAMQIIRELERGPRGVYGGAVGYMMPGGDFDFAIAIRTAVLVGDRWQVTAGAGLVADSVPALECKETRNKARAALAAIAAAKRRARER